MTRYAETTSVSVGRSRGEIDDLLRGWGCDLIRWMDNYATGSMVLEFRWDRGGTAYAARFVLDLPSEDVIRSRSLHASTKVFLPAKFEKLCKARGQSEMRVLLLWLKAAFNAVEVGIIEAEVLFLPFLLDADGRTVAEVFLPRLSKLLSGGAEQLLGLPEGSR